ncbi:tyrosine-type recombinase/integrase [Streptomyces litmocidini]|uniref:tyrosine-type recombinase/integrase n=1 Tax=Streptomyces litmocidini TaxID=67318 RepID=UPI0036F61ED4
MKLRIDHADLAAAVSYAARTLPPPAPVLAGLLLDATSDERLRIRAFDYAVSADATVPAVVTTPGRALVPGRLLADITATLCDDIHLDLDGTRLTPHDFRRVFATEAVTRGLPVHIAARILGHKTLTTTQAYLAVFKEDLVGTYCRAASQTGAGPTGPRRSTASPPSRNGATSSSTSSCARSPSVPADGLTAPRASTNTPASLNQ